jgi:hypothetical protein
MGVTGQTAAAVAACLMVELKAKREDEGEDKLDKRALPSLISRK